MYRKIIYFTFLFYHTMLYPSLQERLNTQYLAIEHITGPLTDEQYRQRPPSGKWSVQENLAHLLSYQPVFMQRVELILNNDNPVFLRYVGDEDLLFLYWRTQPRSALLARLETDRAGILALIGGLSASQLERRGTHTVYGNFSVQDLIEMFLLHEAHHMYTVFQLVHLF